MIDVNIVGSGPNGLAAAVVLARAGLDVRVYEAEATIGGGARTSELTEPGFLHDWGSAVHAMAFASPFFQQFGIDKRIPFVIPDISYGHALDHGAAVHDGYSGCARRRGAGACPGRRGAGLADRQMLYARALKVLA